MRCSKKFIGRIVKNIMRLLNDDQQQSVSDRIKQVCSFLLAIQLDPLPPRPQSEQATIQ